MTAKKKLIIIGGPTASGKTDLGIQIAEHYGTEILSADSRQFYKEMSIGTAKPELNDLARVKHHFIGNLSIHNAYSVGDFERNALDVLSNIFEKKDKAVMVGGTGLYIRAVCEGLDEFPDVPLSMRHEYELIFEKQGIVPLQKELQELDPEYFAMVDIQNPNRLIRALSVCQVSGKPFSSFLSRTKAQRNFEPIYIALELPREVLYDRINHRVDNMMSNGLLEEARNLYPFQHLNALQTVGYTELFAYFEGLMSLEESIDKIKQHTRNYAKRQMTWFRKNDFWHRISPSDTEGVLSFIGV